MNTLSRIVEKNYNRLLNLSGRTPDELIESDKRQFNRDLQKDVDYFNENIEPKPISFTYMSKDSEIAIKIYRLTGNRYLLDNLSGTLKDVKTIKRNKFLLNNDLKRNKMMPLINGVLAGAMAGAVIAYSLTGESLSESLQYTLGMLSGVGFGGLGFVITEKIGMNREYEVNNIIQEAHNLDIRLDVLGVRDKLKTSYEEKYQQG